MINFLPICRLAHFLLYQLVCHNAKVVTSSPIDQHALMMVQITSNSAFIRSPFQCARAKVLRAIILIPMGYRRNSVDAPKSLSAFQKKESSPNYPSGRPAQISIDSGQARRSDESGRLEKSRPAKFDRTGKKANLLVTLPTCSVPFLVCVDVGFVKAQYSSRKPHAGKTTAARPSVYGKPTDS